MTTQGAPWWRSAVIYQVYIRSFADSDGDGIGDIAGIRSRLPYLAGLGVDAVWVNPWYPSPMADAGYDVTDYRAIEPVFGTLADAEALVSEAHQHGLRVLLDIVPNHTSDRHPWFQAALGAEPGSPERDRYIFKDGRGRAGELAPSNVQSQFGGPAWSRVTEADGRPGQWYLHLFAPEQPDLNWSNAEVRADFLATLRFWFDRGVDGFRIDVAHGLVKDPRYPDVSSNEEPGAGGQPPLANPYWDQDGVHEIYRAWRRLGDSYDPPRVFVGEAWVAPASRLANYVRPDELETTFNFDFLLAPWLAKELRVTIDNTMANHRAVKAAPTWVLSNHDVAREVSRYARPQGVRILRHLDDLVDLPADFEVGRRRARAAALLMLALPGSAYVYQGEELGLAEVEDLPVSVMQDPSVKQTGGARRGRDGCRVPIPWSGTASPFGFSPPDAAAPPWLPQPASWASQTVEAETAEPESFLSLYRLALAARRALPALGDGDLAWLDVPDGAIGFTRQPGFTCLTNLTAEALAPPESSVVLLASGPLGPAGAIPTDTTVWLSPAS